MLTTMRQIGNSRGLLIPAAFLASCQIEDKVDLILQDGQIVIKPVKRKLRDNWFAQDSSQAPTQPVGVKTSGKAKAMKTLRPNHDSAAWADLELADDSEWTW